MTATPSFTRTITPSRTPKGICNDVKNYLFGRISHQVGTLYKVHHGMNMTQWYYPGYDMIIGRTPSCIESETNCTCTYDNGDATFCAAERKGIVVYKYSLSSEAQTTLVSDEDPVCFYRFQTTFHPPYFSHTPSVTGTASSTPSVTASAMRSPPPPFIAGAVRRLEKPPGFPHLPPNASMAALKNIATSYINTLSINTNSTTTEAVETLLDTLNVLASSLIAAGIQTPIRVNNNLFSWVALPAPVNGNNASVEHDNFKSVLPPLAPGMVYSMMTKNDPSLRRNGTDSSMPQFSINALSTSNSEVGVTGLATPLSFSLNNVVLNSTMTIECVYWNGTDWDGAGCVFANGTCFCTHFTEFSARVVSIIETNQLIFENAGAVYSAEGFAKYVVIYGVLLGITGGLIVMFCAFVQLDMKAEQKYRTIVEDIDEVCAVLGYPKPLRNVVQPQPALPRAIRAPFYHRLCVAWFVRLVYQHSYISLFFKYDPRLPRTFRLLLVVIMVFHTLFITTFFYGHTKVSADMSISESMILSVITALLNVPFIKLIFLLIRKAGKAEYVSRFPSYAHEYLRRRRFEDALASVHTDEIEWVARRVALGIKASVAIRASPRRGLKHTSQEQSGLNLLETQQIADDSADNLAVLLCMRCLPCFKKHRNKVGGLELALDITQGGDQHWTQPMCNCLPTKSWIGFFVSCVCFGWIGWCINYLLLFTASNSTRTMNTIAESFGASQAMSIFMTQPLTLFLTLAGTWVIDLWKRRRIAAAAAKSKDKANAPGISEQHSIGYFADPMYVKHSTLLSGTWAYWIFMYAGSKVSIGSNVEQTMLGASNQRVALAWLEYENTSTNNNVSSRDAAITTLYLYLRGLRKPVRNTRIRENALELTQRVLEDLSGAKIGIVVCEKEEEVEEASQIVGKILTQ